VDNLRNPSPRPEVVVDPAARAVLDPASQSRVGQPGPFGRERLLYALPLNPGPALLSPPTVLRDPGPAFVADASLGLIGVDAVWVSRMLCAGIVEDTRRL